MNHPYAVTAEELAKDLSSSPQGLSSQEVQARLERYGPNRLAEKKKKTLMARFAAQFKDVMILILLLAAAISFFAALEEGEAAAFFEPGLILLIVVLNAVVGVLQESKAEKALEALQGLSGRDGAGCGQRQPGPRGCHPPGGRGPYPRRRAASPVRLPESGGIRPHRGIPPGGQGPGGQSGGGLHQQVRFLYLQGHPGGG